MNVEKYVEKFRSSGYPRPERGGSMGRGIITAHRRGHGASRRLTLRSRMFFLLLLAALCWAPCCSQDEFGGLGIEVPSGSGKVSDESPYRIVHVYPGGTGDTAGLKEGDRIVSINGTPLEGLTSEVIASQMLRGKVGTRVVLEIERGGARHVFSVTRGRVVVR